MKVELTLTDRFIDPLEEGVDVTVRIPSFSSASFYQLVDACAGRSDIIDVSAAEQQPTLVALAACDDPRDLMVLAHAPDDERGYLYRHALVAAGDALELAPPYQRFEPSAVTITNAPPTLDEVLVSQRIGGLPVLDSFASVPLSSGTGTTTLQAPLAAGATVVTRTDSVGAFPLSSQHVVVWGPATAVTTVDLANPLRAYTSRPTFDAATHAVSWTEEDEGAIGDAVLVGMSYVRPATGGVLRWEMVAARGPEPRVIWPRLPRRELEPRATQPPEMFELVTLATDGDDARIRSRLLGRWTSEAPWPIEGTSGRVRFQALVPH